MSPSPHSHPQSTVQLGVSVVFSILCFVPLYHYRTHNIVDSFAGDDDQYYFTSFNKDPFFVAAESATLMISVIPALDLLIDLVPLTWFFLGEREMANANKVNVIRMRLVERALFICGLVACSVGSFPGVRESGIQVEIFLCAENIGTILTIVPVIAFLCRCSTVCTPICTTLISTIVCTASLLSSVALVIDEGPAETVGVACCVLVDIAAGLFFLMVCMSLWQGWLDYIKSSEVRVCCWLLVAGCWLLVVDYLLFADCCLLFAVWCLPCDAATPLCSLSLSLSFTLLLP